MTKRAITIALSLLLILPLLITVGGSFVAQKIPSFEGWDFEYTSAIKDALKSERTESSKTYKISEENRYIVRFSDGATINEIENALEGRDYALISESKNRLVSLSVDNEDFFEINSHIINYFEPDEVRSPLATVNDPIPMPSYDTLGLYAAWDHAKGSEDIIVAVLDTGIFREHEDLADAKILNGYDAITRTAGVYEDSAGHGTAITGLIAATANNGIGIAGVAHGVTILPVKVSSSGTTIYSSDLVRGIRFAADAGAKIINMSIGGYSQSYAEQEAINYARSKGCILIAAAGNGGNTEYSDQPSYPASYDGVISVASCNDSGEHSSFSQSNEFVDITAPGENLTVLAMDDEGNSIYRTDSGTSYSCALVSGIVALTATRVGGARFETEELISLFIDSSGFEKTEDLGHGIIDCNKILSNADLPIVTGVANGINYSETVKISFNRGIAFLGDEQIEDGETVVANGSHILVVRDGQKEKTVKFKLDHTPLSYTFREFASYAYFEFSQGNATLNGFPYKSKERITASGLHEFILTDGDEKISKTVDLEYFLPTVYGVADGQTYTTPIEIAVVGSGRSYLNGEAFYDKIILSESGDYVLTVKSESGGSEKDYCFTLDFPEYLHFDSDYADGKAAIDTENGFICLYGDSLVGVRIYDIANPEKYKYFLPVGRVYDHAFSGDKLYLLGDEGVTTIDRTLALTTKESVISTFDSDLVTYYAYADGNIYGFGGNNLYIIDPETETDSLVDDLGFNCEKAFFYNQKFYLLAPSKDSLVRIYDPLAGSLTQYDLGYSLDGLPICFGDGYISAGNRLHRASDGKFVFEFAGYEAIMISGSRLYTPTRVFEFTTGKEIGGLPFSVSSIAATEDANWLFGTHAEFACITKGRGGIYDFGGAVNRPSVLSTPESQTEYRTNLYYRSNSTLQSAASSNDALYMLFADCFAVYGMSLENLLEIPQIDLKYKPEKVFCSEGYLIVSFTNASFIYLAKENDLYNGRYLPFPHSCKDALIFGNSLMVVTENRLVDVNLNTFAINPTEINAKSIEVADGFLFVLQDEVIWKYDRYLNKVQTALNVDDSGTLMIGDSIALGKSLYSPDTNESIKLDDKILAHRGNVVVTKKGVYDLKARQYFGKTGINQPKFATISGRNQVIVIGDERISVNYCAEGEDITTAPNISGIENFGVYAESTTVSYDHGVGYIDGKLHRSGDKVSGVGNHIFSLSLPCGRNLEIRFNIEAKLSEIKFVSEDLNLSVGEKIALHVMYLPDGARSIPVTYEYDGDGLEIDENGVVTALAVGRHKVEAIAKTENGSVITAQTTITVRDDLIAFKPDSGYIIDRNGGLIYGIIPGTDASEFLSMLATNRNLLITDENGNQVSGHIGTGDKITLVGSDGNPTDELYAVIKGDTDGDGFITAYDLYVQERILKGYQYTAPYIYAADVNGNGVLADNDYRTLKKILFGRIESPLGVPQKGLFGFCDIQTVSVIRQGDIIEAAVCINGAKYATSVFGKINYEGLEFIEVNSAGWEADCFNNNGVISFCAFGQQGDACAASFKVLLTLKFRVTAAQNEKIKLYADDFTVSYETKCETLSSKGMEATVTPFDYGEFSVSIFNAESFEFSPDKHEYEITLPYNSALADISICHKENQKAALTSYVIPDSGTQTVVITFSDENNVTEFYTITAKRADAPDFDSNCKLQQLEIEGHKLSPSFNPDFFRYSITVPHGTEKINVYCIAQNPTATTVISDTTLNGEDKDVKITVGTPDGETLTYTIKVKFLPPEESESQSEETEVDIASDDIENSKSSLTLWILLFVILSGGAATYVLKEQKSKTE